MEDDKIVDLYLQRDDAAISETDKKYGSRLFTASLNITEDRRDAEECKNSTYFETWNTIPPNEPRQYLFPYLMRIIRNLSLNICRAKNSQKRRVTYVTLSDEFENCIPSPDDTECRLDDMAIRKAINGFLSSLPTDKRRVFMRRYFYGDSVSAIAAGYGMNENNVKAVLYRCRQKLLSYLKKEGIEL